MIGSSHSSIEPHGRHRKSSEPVSRSWRAGMHGSEPVTWRSKRTDARREPVEVRRGELGDAVRADEVAVEAVEEDDDDVARHRRRRRAVTTESTRHQSAAYSAVRSTSAVGPPMIPGAIWFIM